ncbi:uncharacterized protein MONOS_1613 [Monocercomonoides exilis]|uniref:uncharacterized protein n=1 Tax=Monocercomonoides exilis TaxID=2049356 RepID=UPI0035599245|nr:hypothetical protein MONOS_1613 [Monocercomonoides exilis]|eukprot:MONOS_1613.1-p1 / transcript=MONOS_1613.1 / gene=MONOS_1613 / organism=Monocercomonoides_exilis_PA203 / gene_product=unspecified product / transcript_product=unspecified product / location=Mono_scaffold00029:108640-118228(-) / protein_length=2966 / sequence_SO=supercontig / SO=protein_coding / is_pseudo=false
MRNPVIIVLSFVASASILQRQCMPLGATIEDASSKERVKDKEKIPACEYSFDHGEFEMKTFDTKNKEMHCSLKNGDSEGTDERKRVLMKNKENKAKVKSNDRFDEKREDCANTDILKVGGKGNGFGKSEMKGSVVLKNSSVHLRGLRMGCGDGKGIACAWSESEIVMDGCGVIVESGISPLDLKGSCAILTNISLKTSKTQFPQIPPFFASNPTEDRLPHFGRVSICSSHFSSMTLSSAPFLSSPSIESASLSNMVFFNISTSSSSRGSVSACYWESCTLMDGCLFSSVCDAYDGGIIQSINSPLSSLVVSNTSFVGCCRTRNVEFIGSEDNKKSPGRKQISDNGANSFTWCEWNGSRTVATANTLSDGASNGGAISLCNLKNGSLTGSHCTFNDCTAHYTGGGIVCYSIKSIKIENNSFNACVATTQAGGGIYVNSISTCVLIGGCEFLNCQADGNGGGLGLEFLNVSGSACIRSESGKGESACIFECSFTSCSITGAWGGGMYCYYVSAAFKMRSMQFISCSAVSCGGGLDFRPYHSTAPSNNLYCYFFFFHECRCSNSTPYGHDVFFQDYYNLFSSANPFYESYTTNSNDTRVCHLYYSYQYTEKKDWLKEGMKDRCVGVGGSDASNLCGMSESAPCKTVCHAVGASMAQLNSSITVLGGKHVNEEKTISVGEKKISVLGRGKTVSVIGTSALSSPATTLFSISSGQLEVGHVGIDHNPMKSPSPSVFVVTDGSGSLSLEDVLISSSVSGGSGISSSVFEVALRQLKMIDVEIKNIKMSQPLFAEPSSAGSTLGESILGNVTIRNVNRKEGDGVMMTKNVKGEETFVVWNTTMDGCACMNGNGGGIKVELEGISSKVRIGDSTSHSGGTTAFHQCKCRGFGGGIMLFLADNSFDFTISSVSFVGCSATLGGKDVFVNGSRFVSGTITTTKLNVGHNRTIYDELMGYDRNEIGMGIFPLNVFLDAFSGAAHVGKVVNGCGGYDSWFCGFGYFPCSTIIFAAQNRFSSSKKNIVLDPGFELGEVVLMAGTYEWEVYCTINKTNVNVRLPSGMASSYLINVESSSSIKNIAFQIPFSLSSATSLIGLTSSSLTLTDCSVAHSSESTSIVAFGYCFVNAQSGNLKMDRFVIEEGMTFNDHSAIEFCEGMTSVICSGCNISGVKRNEGDGGWMKGTVGSSGTLTVDGCNVNGCSCIGGKGGGIYVVLKGNGKVDVNGTSVIDGNKAENNEGRGGRGGGMFVLMESGGCGLTIGQNVEFSKVNGNVAEYGKDVFVHCGSGVFLESKVNASSFSFFDTSEIPSDMLQLSGGENGDENGVIPLFVYLCSMGTKVIVDGSGGNGMDHNHCGFERFGCLTVDYCANSRMSESSKEIEVASSSSIKDEIELSSFNVSISGRIVSSDGERIQVNVSDGGSATQDWLVGCSSSLTMRRLSFVVKGQLNSRRSAFIHSTSSTLSVTNCSVSFESGALTDGKIGYSIINMAGGYLIVDGFVMESGVTLKMNGKSPITMANGAELELKNSRVSGVGMEGGSEGGGCLNVGMGVNGNAKIEECNISSTCSGESGMKGGGMMISIGSEGNLEMKNVKFEGCEVPREDVEDGGRGLGGGMFVKLPDEMGTFVLERMIFEGCNAWKGKNLFVSGWDLSEIVNEEHMKWEMSSEELRSLDELCGWERKTTGEGYMIPLVVYLWDNWSGNGFVSKEKGGDFSGCGFSEAPCSSVDHLISLRYATLGEAETSISIVGSGLLQKSISLQSSSLSMTPIVSIEGSEKGTVLKVREMDDEGIGESMITSNICFSLMNLSFSLPNELGKHLSFIQSLSSSSATLSIKMSSFVCEDSTREMNYCTVKVDGGSVLIEDCSLSQFVLVKGFLEFAPEVDAIDVVNLTISNTSISEKSLISLEEEAHVSRWNKNEERNPKTMIRINSSIFTNITSQLNNPCIVNMDSFSVGVECVMEGCVLTKCMSEMSEEGGGVKMCVKGGESDLKVSGCSFVMCECSIMNGRGGGVMIDALDPNEECIDTKIPPLGLRMETIRFVMNEAFVGKDVFIKCHSIAEQVNETLFVLDFSQDALKSNNSICGRDAVNEIDIDLIPLITFFHSVQNVLWIDGECLIGGECEIGDLNVKSLKRVQATIHFNTRIEETGSEGSAIVFLNECVVERCEFVFGESFEGNQKNILKEKDGRLEISECRFSSATMDLMMKNTIVIVESGELKISETIFDGICTTAPLLSLTKEVKIVIFEANISEIVSEGEVIGIGMKAEVEMKEVNFENISVVNEGSVMRIEGAEKEVSVLNCSFAICRSTKEKGRMMEICECLDVLIGSCLFVGGTMERNEQTFNEGEEMCRWDGSLVDVVKSSVLMKDTTISNSSEGGITMSGGNVIIEKGEFLNNNPSIEGYPSLRRNVICTDSGILKVMSLKGGDGGLPNSSLWMLNEGCSFEGIASERDSSFFIPVLEKKEVEGSVGKDLINSCGDEIEVSVHVLFGNEESPSSTNSLILKNASEAKANGDEIIVEGGKEGKSYWLLIVIVLVVILLIVLIVSIILAVRWRKQKRRTEELEIIVEDNIRKDPKAFEMMTMEMSPKEQWRKSEREAEQKNERNVKKRVYEKAMVHSESEEHLLSESGSTEYILGRDSDKIPDWALEKEEEEEIRKRSPSPSISSTSTTDTSDTDTTFVRSESLCPTTSSMSNLVDAMACSSPHEKLIVDLRDSLFMLLHGRNEKKEMAIGTLQEREQTAAQILFWVANLALHSFDEMENPLSSLKNLSPHIVLFSEHMVICIAMHSDCSSDDDDSDSSSISSSTIVTSASDDDDDRNSLASSAFEDEEDNRNECLRWKAPELMNKKMGATKKSVVFSIGMMLWECLTLKVPFGDYEAVIAGQKIMNGERPRMSEVSESSFCELVKGCFWKEANERIGLESVKRECVGHFPKEKLIMTISDGIYIQNGRIVRRSYVESGDEESEERQTIKIVLPGKIVE